MVLFVKILLIVLAYLFGSIPWGYLLGRLKGIDITKHGSKNIGATNTGRVLGRKYAIIAFILDMVKGIIFPGLFTFGILDSKYCLLSPMVYGLASVLGHTFSIYLKFKGGKAVATGSGVLFAFSPTLFAICFIAFIIITSIFKYVSLGSLIGAFIAFIGSVIISINHHFSGYFNAYFPIGTVIIVTIIFLRHSTNIKRIINNNENKIKL